MAALISKLLVCSLPCIQPPILVVHGPAPYCLSRAESDCENDLCPFYFLCGTHEVMFSLSHHGPVSHPDYGTVWNQKVLRAWCASLLPSRGDQCCGERRRKRERESERARDKRLHAYSCPAVSYHGNKKDVPYRPADRPSSSPPPPPPPQRMNKDRDVRGGEMPSSEPWIANKVLLYLSFFVTWNY